MRTSKSAQRKNIRMNRERERNNFSPETAFKISPSESKIDNIKKPIIENTRDSKELIKTNEFQKMVDLFQPRKL